MPNKPELIEQYEDNLWEIVYNMNKDGIDFTTTKHILQEMVNNLDVMSYCERWAGENYV